MSIDKTHPNMGRRAFPGRGSLIALATAFVSSTVLVVTTSPVVAAPYLSPFEIDGNTTVQGAPPAGGVDWTNMPGVAVINDTNYTSSGVQTVFDASGCGNTNETIHVNSDKFNNYPWPAPIAGNTSGKTDICQGYVASEVRTTPASAATSPDHPGTDGDAYGYFGVYRRDASGASSLWIELNQTRTLDANGWASKTTNDLLIGIDFPRQAGAVPDIYYARWNGSGWENGGNPVLLNAYVDFAARGTSSNGRFAEAAVNLSQLVSGCAVYRTASMHSYAASLPAAFQTSAVDDFVPATSLPTEISTCPTLTIDKIAVSSPIVPPEPATFGITVANEGQIAARGLTLTDVLPTDGGITWSIVSVTGSVSPSLPACSITSGTLTCGKPTTFPSAPPLTATIGDWGFILDAGETFTVTVRSSATTEATADLTPLDNTAVVDAWNATKLTDPAVIDVLPSPTLSLTKQVDGRLDSADQFTVTIADTLGASIATATTSGVGTSASTGGQAVGVGTFVLSESVASGPNGLSAYSSTIACTNAAAGSSTVLPSGPGTSFAIDLAAGDDVTCTFTNAPNPLPALTIEKTRTGFVDNDGDGIVSAGDVIEYDIVVANTGNVTIGSIVIDELGGSPPVCAGPTRPSGSAYAGALIPGDSVTCTSTYLVTAADVDTGFHDNTASISSASPQSGELILPTGATVRTPIPQNPSLTLTKSITSGLGPYDDGDIVTYSFTITNSGDVTLSGVFLDDALLGLTAATCGATTIPAGGTASCTGSYVVTVADVLSGLVVNTATAMGTSPLGAGVSDDATATLVIEQNPALELVKSHATTPTIDTDGNGIISVGDTITYDFTITNTGDVTLDAIGITDPLPGLSAVTCVATTLAPTESTTCTATYVVTAADGAAGQTVNEATASGTTRSGVTVSTTAGDVVPIVERPSIAIVKQHVSTNGLTSGSWQTDWGSGDTLDYRFTVVNDGDTPLSSVTVADSLVASVTCPQTTLAFAESIECTGSYTVTDADVLAGFVTNMADVDADSASGTAVAATATHTALTTAEPAIDLVKSVNGVPELGATLDYSFRVTNVGATSLSGVAVTDPMFTGVTCPVTSLARNESTVCAASYTVTQADVDSGAIANTAAASGSSGAVTVTATASVTVDVPRTASMTLAKTHAVTTDVAPVGIVTTGDIVTYSIVITNDGTTTLSGVAYSDTLLGAVDEPIASCGDADGALAPTESVTCIGTHTVTQAEVDAGLVTNNASTTATPPAGLPAPTAAGSTTIVFAQTPGISVTKTLLGRVDEDGSTNDTPGDTFTYQLVVTNTGLVTLDPVTVSDARLGVVDATCGALTSLAPGDSTTCTFTASPTQDEIDAGVLSNVATATGQPPGGVTPVTDTSLVDSLLLGDPSLAIAKSLVGAAPDPAGAGDILSYEFVVTNTGNVTIADVSVTDSLGVAVTCPDTTLTPGESVTCDGSYTITQDDIDGGAVVNTATVDGTPPPSSPPLPAAAPAEVTTTLAKYPALGLDKLATNAPLPSPVQAGDVISYTITASNTGNVTLTNVSISDPLVEPLSCGQPVTLAPGDSLVCAASHTVTQADVDGGVVDNTATAVGSAPTDDPVQTASASESVPIERIASFDFVKALASTSTDPVSLGTVLNYSFVVTNTGNTTLTDLLIADPTIGLVSCPVAQLTPGVTITCLAADVVTQADVDVGEVVNVATATVAPPPGVAPVDPVTPPAVVVDIPQNPELSLVKSLASVSDLDVSGGITAGDVLDYQFEVTNSGNVTISDIAVTDSLGISVTCPLAILGPTESMMCTASHVVTQTDVDTGTIDNTATPTGTPPGGVPADFPVSSVSTPIAAAPAVSLVKASSGIVSDVAPTDVVSVGDVIGYTFTIANTGNVTLAPVTLTDVKLGLVAVTIDDPAIACSDPGPALAPGAQTVCTASYDAVTQTDIDVGTVWNDATVSATDPNGTVVEGADAVDVSVGQVSELTFAKTASVDDADADGLVEPGDVITYAFDVTNTGSTTLSGVTIVDPLPGLSALSCTPVQPAVLPPTATLSCSATYSVTPSDIDSGSVTNTATASAVPPPGASPLDDVTASAPVGIDRVATVELGKSIIDLTTPPGVGDVVTYEFVVANAGNVTLTGLEFDDAKLGLLDLPLDTPAGSPANFLGCTPSVTSLLAGSSTTCQATYEISQADVDDGGVLNVASITAVPPAGLEPVLDTGRAELVLPQNPSVTLAKTVVNSSPPPLSEGDVLDYRFAVLNDGDVTLSIVTLVDLLPGLGPISCAPLSLPATLTPGQGTTCTAAYTVTAADVAVGSIVNDATVTASPPVGPLIVASDSKTALPTENPSISLTKSAVLPDPDLSVGDVVTFELEIVNTGDVSLTDVSVSDPMPALSPVTCGAILLPTTLGIGDSLNCVVSYVVTQGDIDRGLIENTATATGTSAQGGFATDSDSERLVPTQSPGLELSKSLTFNADEDDSVSVTAGDTLTYTLSIVNTGNVTLSDLLVDDAKLGLADLTCGGISVIGPTESTSCDVTYTVTQADVDAGVISNTAAAGAVSPVAGQITDTDTEVVAPGQVSALAITKSIGVADPTPLQLGSVITYNLRVSNIGTVTLFDIVVADPLVTGQGGTVVCPNTSGGIGPAQFVDCTATYTVTQSDVDAGQVVNGAVADATPPVGAPAVVPARDTDVVSIQRLPAIDLAKQYDLVDDRGPAGASLGDMVEYSLTVTNTGNVTLDAISVSDPLVDPGPDCGGTTTLAPDEAVTCTATYTITQTDVDAGLVHNEAIVAATSPNGAVVDASASVDVRIDQNPAIEFEKSASPAVDPALGETITYTFKITNAGDVTLNGITITDPLPGLSTVDCGPLSSLAPADTHECVATYLVTQSDVDAGQVSNLAGVTAFSPLGVTAGATAGTVVPIIAEPLIFVDKIDPASNADQDGSGGVSLGDTLTYTFVVSNGGNVTLSAIRLSDPLIGVADVPITDPSIACSATLTDGSLVPGEITVCRASYSVTQADVDAGTIVNVATAIGQPPTLPDGTVPSPIASPPDSVTTPVVREIALTVTESLEAMESNGDGTYDVTFRITVGNAGTVTLLDVSVYDDILGQFSSAHVVPGSVTAADGSLLASALYDGSQDSDALAVGQALAPGESGDVLVSFTIAPTVDAVLSNVATAEARDATGTLLDPVLSPTVFVEVVVEEGALAGTAFVDVDDDGVFTAGVDIGLGGVPITLTGANVAGPIEPITVLTASNGSYIFADLVPGTYVLTGTQPAGYLDGEEVVGSLGGVVTANDTISAIVLPPAGVGTAYGFGEQPSASIAGSVVDSSGSPIVGVVITLVGVDSSGNEVTATAVTGVDGSYEFTGLPAGIYELIQTQPVGYGDGEALAGGPGSATGPNVIAGIVLVGTGQLDGYVFIDELGSLAGVVFQDLDGDGVQDPGEPGLGGVKVDLSGVTAGGDPVDVTVVTGADGSFLFDHLRGGGYTMTATQPAAYRDGPDTAGAAGGIADGDDSIAQIELEGGQHASGYTFAELGQRLTGTVFVDIDGDGRRDAGEPPLPGATVNLFGATGRQIATTVTTAAGTYTFEHLPGGEYRVELASTGSTTTPSSVLVLLDPNVPTIVDFGMSSRLPRTGRDPDGLILVAWALVAVGAALLWTGRRRRMRHLDPAASPTG